MMKLKGIREQLGRAVLLTLLLLLLCGFLFPLLLQGLGGLIFPAKAAGSLVTVNGEAVGARFVGQEFTEPYFMKGRPSAVHYNTYTVTADGERLLSDGSPYTGPASGSRNYGPSNPALTERIEGDVERFLRENPAVSRETLPAELFTASGSGLDPHISPEAAAVQLPAIAEASGLSEELLGEIVADNTGGKLLGILGEERVNVLGVNIGIAEAMGLV